MWLSHANSDVALGACMQLAFEKADADYESFLKIDSQLEGLLSNLPPWLKPNASAVSSPPAQHAQLMRSTYHLTSHHKLLSIHRPLALAKRQKATYDFSRRRVVLAAREILQEGAKLEQLPTTPRIWTVAVRCHLP